MVIRLVCVSCLGALATGAGDWGCFAGASAAPFGQSGPSAGGSVTVTSKEQNLISIGFTPEEGWRGEIDLRPEVTVGGVVHLRLGVGGQTLGFLEEAAPWEIRPEEVALFAEGPLWDGGSPAKGVLGDFRLPLPESLGGDSRRNGVRGVGLTDIGIRPGAVASLFFGWTSQNVYPLSRSEESPGSDYLTGGGRLRWTPTPEYNVDLAAAWRQGSVNSREDAGWCYREDVGAVALSRPWHDLRLSAWAGWQARRAERDLDVGRQLTGFGALELMGERRDQRRHRHWQAIRTYVVPAEFLPWAARRSTAANPFYRWRGEAGVEWEGVTWLGTPASEHRLQWQLGAGWRVKELPEHDELVSHFISGVVSPAEPDAGANVGAGVDGGGAALPLDTPLVRARVELAGETPAFASGLGGWFEQCEYRWRAQLESGYGGWTDFRLRRTFQGQVGAIAEWTPSYTVRWESPQWVVRNSGSEGDSEDDTEESEASDLGAGLSHTLSLVVKLSLGSIQGITTNWSRSITVGGHFTDTWSITYDSPNGWEWRFKWTSPDDPDKSTDSYCEVRQRFEL